MKDAMKKFIDKMKKDDYYTPSEVKEKEEKKDMGKVEKVNRDKWDYVVEKFKTRRSVRKFSSDPVEWKCIYEIVEGALNGPCAGNVQNIRIIVVRNKGIIEEIARAESQQYWVADAPVVLVVVRSDDKLQELYPDYGKTYSIQNGAAAVQNILMMAHFHNLGACWVESCDNEVLAEILKIPSNQSVDAVVPIGYPLEKPEVNKDPLNSHIYYDEYGNRKRN